MNIKAILFIVISIVLYIVVVRYLNWSLWRAISYVLFGAMIAGLYFYFFKATEPTDDP